jgi:hypothetical protein
LRSEHSQGGAQRSEQYLYGAQRAIESKARSALDVRFEAITSPIRSSSGKAPTLTAALKQQDANRSARLDF